MDFYAWVLTHVLPNALSSAGEMVQWLREFALSCLRAWGRGVGGGSELAAVLAPEDLTPSFGFCGYYTHSRAQILRHTYT